MEVRNNLKNFLLKSFVVLFIYLLDRISKIYILHLSNNNFENECEEESRNRSTLLQQAYSTWYSYQVLSDVPE